MIVVHRSIVVFYQRTLLRLAPCLPCLRATSPRKACRMTIQSSCTEIPLKSSVVSSGPFMPCKTFKPISGSSPSFCPHLCTNNSPHEIMVVRGPRLDLNRFINIAKVASKYSFKSIETWALDVIQEFIERKPSPLLDTIPIGFPFSTNSPPTALAESKRQISRLVQLAQTCGHANLLETMITLLRQLMPVSLHFSYLAMSLADDLDLRELRGLAYLEVLQRSAFICGRDENGNDLAEGDVHESSDGLERLVVGPTQQLRLLSGYHRLSKAWEKLRAIPIPFEHGPSCGTTWHQHGCTQSWSEFWKEKTRADGVLALGAANVIGKLQIILKEFDKWGSATYMHHECKSVARRAIQDAIKHISNSLPDFFHEGGQY